jgi:hypothetical protein
MILTNEQIVEHTTYIKSMDISNVKAFFKCAHENHIYYDRQLPFFMLLLSILKGKHNDRKRDSGV